MPEMVTLTHPNLPGRQITVRERAARSREKAGWQRTTDLPSSESEAVEPAENTEE